MTTKVCKICQMFRGKSKQIYTLSLRNLSADTEKNSWKAVPNAEAMYVHDISSGNTTSDSEPKLVKETAATAYVDGQNLLGPVVGNFSMKIAIEKAKQSGVGWVVASGSNHYGIAGYYALQACGKGLLPILGSNPLCLAAPANDGDSFVLDMATSTCALGKIELHDRKGIDIPTGWGVDGQGKASTDPKPVLEGGGLMPLGGSELTGGYKGYGLAMLVEIFCGILGNAAYGPNIRKWKNDDRVANLGQCFIAVDPNAFAPGFSDRMEDLISICRGLEPMENETEVLVAGDPERQHMSMCDSRGGIPYHPNQIAFGIELATKLSVKPMGTC